MFNSVYIETRVTFFVVIQTYYAHTLLSCILLLLYYSELNNFIWSKFKDTTHYTKSKLDIDIVKCCVHVNIGFFTLKIIILI